MQEMQDFVRRTIQQARDGIDRLSRRRSSASQNTWPTGTETLPDDVPQQPRSSFVSLMITQYEEFLAAVRFLTVLPVPARARFTQTAETLPTPIVGSGYFPLVGLLLGALLALWALFLSASLRLPSLMVAVLVLIVQILFTGGLHLDGLMDSCDGLFGGTSRERKLEIMRDSRVGSFGVLGGACTLLFKFAALVTLADSNYLLPLALLIVLPLARWAMVLTVYVFPSARAAGLGADFRQTVTRPRLLLATIVSLVVVLAVGRLPGLAAWFGGGLAALLVGAWATRVLGGLTGDIYGAIEEVAEMVALLLLVLLRFWF
jgi:adenosylcobinamide-GDP ribazoletransferase